MTHHGHVPTRHNRRYWTAYERSNRTQSFDYDALSDLTHAGLWSSSVTDWEDITILNGLGPDSG